MTRWDVFFAHAGADKARIRELLAALRDLGLVVFIDEEIPLGSEWDLAIPAAQRDSRATVACLSPAYTAAFYERAEVHDAIRLQRRGGHLLIPVHLDGPPGPDDVLYGLRLVQGLVLPQVGVREAARRIAEAVRGVPAGAGTVSPPSPPSPVAPTALFEALCRLGAASFDELVFRSGLPRASLLPAWVEQSRRAINLIEHASEADAGYEALVSTLRAMRPGML